MEFRKPICSCYRHAIPNYAMYASMMERMIAIRHYPVEDEVTAQIRLNQSIRRMIYNNFEQQVEMKLEALRNEEAEFKRFLDSQI